MNTADRADLIIIGAGAAGLAAALYASRFKLTTVVIAKEMGGTGNIAHQVDNWIGEPGIAGWDLMQKFVRHVEQYGVPMITAEVVNVARGQSGFTVSLADGTERSGAMVLLANGMVHRKLGIQGEDRYAGKGVHYCYTCDGPLYRGKILAVVGGSDSAALGSLFLAGYADKIFTIFRRDQMTAEPISLDKVAQQNKIELVSKSNVVEIRGDDTRVTSIVLDSGRTLDVNGIFIEIGHVPQNKLAKSLGVGVDARGYIQVSKRQETNVEGVFAAGDITNATELKQFITSAAEGSIAAQTAYNFLQGLRGGYR